MRRKSYIKSLSAIIVLLVFGLVAFFYHNRTPPTFPMWESAEEEETEPGISAKFMSMEKLEDDSIPEPLIMVNMLMCIEDGYSYEPDPRLTWHVDFFFNDQWYTIYQEDPPPMIVGTMSHGAGEYKICTYIPVHSKVFDIKGKYRLYKKGLGYCYLTVN